MEYAVRLASREREDTAVVCGRVPQAEVGPFIRAAFGEVLDVVGPDATTGPPFCRMDMTGDEFVLEVGFPVSAPVRASGRVEPSSLPAGEVATVLNEGPYDSVAPAYFAIEDWLSEHGYEATGVPWEAYLDGPEVPKPRTLVCWPCTSRTAGPD